MILIEELKKRLEKLEPISINIKDDSALHSGHRGNGGGGHFTLIIKSALFNDLSQVARHRMIYQLLNDLMPSKVHALSIKAYASNEQS
jgi:BolA protein